MKKLMLALLCVAPLSAMQKPSQEQIEQAKYMSYAKPAVVTATLANATIMTIGKGGCLLLGPVVGLGIVGLAGAKYAYDKSKGN